MFRSLYAVVSFAMLSFVCLIAASINYSRLEFRTYAPSAIEVVAYVVLPVIVGLTSFALAGYFVSKLITPEGPGPSGPAAGALPVRAVEEGTVLRDVHVTYEALKPERSRIWSIIDELAEALRDDVEGSEAVFVVRERFHRAQFPVVESNDEQEAPKKAAVKISQAS